MKTRKFRCPYCGFAKNFYGDEARRMKKRVLGLTCPKCGKKVNEEDIKKIKGRGPKPKEERRKRTKKKEVKENPIIVAPQPNVEQIEWRTRDSPPPGEHRNRGYGAGRAGWKPKPLQPTERTLGEAVMASRNIRPSAPIPYQNLRSEEKLENKEYREIDIEKLEKHEKKLALLIVRFDRVEERLDKKVKKLDLNLEELDSKLQALSTLTAHMETILEDARRNQPRPQQRRDR